VPENCAAPTSICSVAGQFGAIFSPLAWAEIKQASFLDACLAYGTL